MATYYWVGGSGTWNTTTTTNWSLSSGGGGGAGVPTASDNVIIDPSSGTGTITCAASICADLTITATQAITLGAGSATLSVRGSLTLPTGGSFAYNNSTLLVLGATTTGKTVDCGGRDLGAVTFSGVGGGWTLTSAFSASGSTVTLTSGALNTAGFSFTANIFNSSGTATRSLTLGASLVTITGTQWNTSTITNFTFSAGTSSITMSSSAPIFSTGVLTFKDLIFSSTSITTLTFVPGGCTFDNISIAGRASAGVSICSIQGNATITGTLTISAPTTIGSSRWFFASNLVGINRSITATTASLTDVDFRDITGNVGTPWTGTRLGNCGGNSGITFNAPKSVYWNLAGTNNWSANGWATTSSGAPATTNFPLAQDTAYFTDNNPAVSNVITINAVYSLPTIDFTSRTVGITLGQSLGASCYGSFTLSPAVTLSGSGVYTFIARGGTQTITSASRTWTNSFTINNIGGTVTLADACSSSSTTAFTHTQGTFDLAGFTLTCSTFSSSNTNTRALAFGSTGSFVVTSSGTVWSTSTTTGLTITGTDPKIYVTNASTAATTVTSGTTAGVSNLLSFYFTAGTYTLTLTSSNLFNDLDFTGFAGILSNTSRSIYGNLKLSTGMTLGAGAIVTTFASTATGKTITSNGKTMDFPVTFNGAGGSWILQDAMTIGSTRTVTLTNGTIDLNGFTCTIGTFVTAAGTKNLTFNGGTLNVTGTPFNNAAPTNFTTTAGSGTGTISLTSASAKTFTGGGSTFNCTLNQGGAGTLTITSDNTFNNITNTVTPATVTFTSGTTNTFANFNLNGTAGNLVTLTAVTAGSAFNIVKTGGGVVSCDYLSIKDSSATPSTSTWYAGANSTNVSGNSGWIFTAPPSGFITTEDFGMGDLYSVLVNFTYSIAEDTATADTSTQASAFLQNLTENTTIADSYTAPIAFLQAVTEDSALADASVASLAVTYSIAENVTLNDTRIIGSAIFFNITENTTLADTRSNTAAMYFSQTENLVLADTPGITSAFLQNLTETLASADTISISAAFTGSVTEALTSADVIAGSKGVYLALVENVASAEAEAVQAAFAANAVENINPADSSTQVCQFYFSKAEAITVQELLEVHGWVTIQDGQTANWQAINDTQTANWTTINNTQVSGWTPINDDQ